MNRLNDPQVLSHFDGAYALRARCILPLEAPPPSKNVITISAGRIAAVGQNLSGRAALDLGDVAILPGLINAHTHLEFSGLAAPLGRPAMPLTDWIREVVHFRRTRSEAADNAAQQRRDIELGLAESVQAGVTALGEICTSPQSLPAYQDSAISSVVFLELLGLSAERIAPLLGAARTHLAATGGGDNPIYGGLSPHAPYTVHPELLRQTCRLSAESKAPLAMHLAESRDELELLASRSGSFVDLLQSLDAWDPAALGGFSGIFDYLRVLETAHRALVIHGNYLSDEQIQWLAARRGHMSVVYCPRTHHFFGHEKYPLAKMLAAGVNLALGTDSRASNPDLNLWREARFASAAHSEIAPRTILQMAASGGARALGMEAETGEIAVGKRADLCVVPLVGSLSGDVCGRLFAERSDVAATIVRGRLAAACNG